MHRLWHMLMHHERSSNFTLVLEGYQDMPAGTTIRYVCIIAWMILRRLTRVSRVLQEQLWVLSRRQNV